MGDRTGSPVGEYVFCFCFDGGVGGLFVLRGRGRGRGGRAGRGAGFSIFGAFSPAAAPAAAEKQEAVVPRGLRLGSVACGWAASRAGGQWSAGRVRSSVVTTGRVLKSAALCVRNGWGSRAGGGDRGFPGVRGMVAWLGGAVWCEGGCGRLLGGGGRACTAVTGVCLFFGGLAAPFGGAAAGRFWGAGAHKGRGG